MLGRPARRPTATASSATSPRAGRGTYNFKANAPTLTTIGNNANAATSWTHPFVPSPPQFRPSSPTAGLPVPVDERLVHARLRADAGRPRRDLGRRGCGREPVRHAQPDARLRVLPGLHRAELERPGLQLRPDRDAGGRTTRCSATSRPACSRAQRDNANMIPMPEGVSAVTNMYMWQSIAGAFYAPCVDGDYDMGVIGHEYAHLIENRMIGKGSPHRPSRGRDGREPRRPDRDGVPERERVRPDRRREPVRGRDVRDRQQGPRDPQLRDELPELRAGARAEQAAHGQRAQLQRHGLRPHRPAGPRGRRDLEQDQLRHPAGARRQVRPALPA